MSWNEYLDTLHYMQIRNNNSLQFDNFSKKEKFENSELSEDEAYDLFVANNGDCDEVERFIDKCGGWI